MQILNQKLRKAIDRGTRRAHRGSVVAVLLDGARAAGADRPLVEDDSSLSTRYWSDATKGGIPWHKRRVNLSHILAALPVGLEPLTSAT